MQKSYCSKSYINLLDNFVCITSFIQQYWAVELNRTVKIITAITETPNNKTATTALEYHKGVF